MKTLIAGMVLGSVLLGWAVWTAPKCVAGAERGPTIGGVIKIAGC